MVLTVILKTNADTFSGAMYKDLARVLIYIHTLCMPAMKAQASLCISVSSLLDNAISIKFSNAGSNKKKVQSSYNAIFGVHRNKPRYKHIVRSNNSFAKFHGKKILEPQHDLVISKSV